MPLVSSVLQLGISSNLQPKIKAILEETTTKNPLTGKDEPIGADTKATQLANAIAEVVAAQVDTYIKTATITVPIATPITTTAGPGTLLAPIVCTIA